VLPADESADMTGLSEAEKEEFRAFLEARKRD
jgi:hypothetical protein